MRDQWPKMKLMVVLSVISRVSDPDPDHLQRNSPLAAAAVRPLFFLCHLFDHAVHMISKVIQLHVLLHRTGIAEVPLKP